eukprot:5735622-Pyramimonas_sp.AAC.1
MFWISPTKNKRTYGYDGNGLLSFDGAAKGVSDLTGLLAFFQPSYFFLGAFASTHIRRGDAPVRARNNRVNYDESESLQLARFVTNPILRCVYQLINSIA